MRSVEPFICRQEEDSSIPPLLL
jgi:hypothetical protein